MPAMPARTVYAEETSSEKTDVTTDSPIGQTQVSAWVEADREPDGNEPGEAPGGPGTEDENPDGRGSGQNGVRTGDQNAIWVPMLLLLIGGTVIFSCGKINSSSKRGN